MKIGDETEKPWGKVEKDSRVSCEILRYVDPLNLSSMYILWLSWLITW